MKIVFLFILAFQVSAQANEVCQPEQLAQVRKYILPDISMGSDFIGGLFDKVQTGELKCEISTQKFQGGGELATCGYLYPKALYQIHMGTWTLTVREDKVDCGGSAFWIMNINNQNGSLINFVSAGDKILGQLNAPSCAIANDYRAIQFSYQESSSTRKPNNLILLNVASRECEGPKDGILEFSAQQLGLTSESLKDLRGAK